MRIGRLLLHWGILVALAASLCHAQDKTLIIRPLSDSPAIVKRALVIAVSDYENANHLPETINDARLFADLLRTRFGFPEDAITLMTDAPGTPDRLRPTYTHLVSTIDAVLNGVDAKSEIVVFFSGHGTRFGDHDYLIPLDGAPGSVKATCIDYDEFKSRLKTKTPARALLIVDACRDLSGKGNESGIGGNKTDLGPQIAELVSCQPKEVSQIGKPEDFHESVFTHFLLEGLKGAPEAVNEQGLVTFDSLTLFVKAKVSRYVANKYMDSQNPDGNTTLGSMVLARAAKKASGGKIEPQDTRAQLEVISEPSGATVLIDKKPMGKTPYLNLLNLGLEETKTVQVAIVLEGYEPQVFRVLLEQGKLSTVGPVTLKAINPGNSGGGGNGNGVPPDRKINPKDDAEMMLIPAGPFLMGDDDRGDNPRHTVTLSNYYIYKNLVTVKQYLAFCAATGHAKPPAPSFDPNWSQLDHPIVDVSWEDAVAYCRWAGAQLPTEAQWEKASRGTKGRKFPWGDEFDSSKLWWSKGNLRDAGGTTSVGGYGVSPYGCTDMAGNAWQWCSDWYDANYWSNRAADGSDPENQSIGEKKGRVLRGGSWTQDFEYYFHCANRHRFSPVDRLDNFGFRCVVRADTH